MPRIWIFGNSGHLVYSWAVQFDQLHYNPQALASVRLLDLASNVLQHVRNNAQTTIQINDFVSNYLPGNSLVL